MHKTLSEYPYYQPKRESYLGCLIENNRLMEERLLTIKPLFRDINKQIGDESIKMELLDKLNEYLTEADLLKGIVTVCMGCKKVRNEAAYWQMIEQYISDRTNADFSHTFCPECFTKWHKSVRSK